MNTQCLHATSRHAPGRTLYSGWFKRVFRTVDQLLNDVHKFYNRRREQKISRDALAQLNELDDCLLRDIGISKADVQWANQLPLSVNAAFELRKIADQRRQRW